jgi:predicted small lipoprotein YifL
LIIKVTYHKKGELNMTRLKRKNIFLPLIFTMIFVFAFSVSGYSGNGPINFPPTADAGPDQIAECTSPSGTDVTLDGSASSDPDGDALTFEWTWSGGSATGMNPSGTFPLGSTTATLEVDDGNGATDTDILFRLRLQQPIAVQVTRLLK